MRTAPDRACLRAGTSPTAFRAALRGTPQRSRAERGWRRPATGPARSCVTQPHPRWLPAPPSAPPAWLSLRAGGPAPGAPKVFRGLTRLAQCRATVDALPGDDGDNGKEDRRNGYCPVGPDCLDCHVISRGQQPGLRQGIEPSRPHCPRKSASPAHLRQGAPRA